MENQDSIKKINPLEHLKIFFRRKWLFITPVFVCFVLGIVASFLLPPRYESSTTILIEEEKTINPLVQNLAVSSTAAQRMENIKEIILGWNSLVELTKKLNLAKGAQNQTQFEELIKLLRNSINVQMRQQNIIQISYQGNNPQETQNVTQVLSDILMERNIAAQTKETDVAIKFIQEQLDIYKRKIKQSEIAGFEEQLKKLLADSTEMHPMVRELRQKIAAANKELESGEYEVTDSQRPLAEATKLVLKKELDTIITKESQASISQAANPIEEGRDPNAAIYKLLLMDKVGSSMAQDIDVNKGIYQMLLQRLETAKITQRLETSKEGTRYTIIEPPRLPLKPLANNIKVILASLVVGIFAGTGLVFGKELLDQSFLDIEDAKQTLELPVLGAISRLTTQEEIDKEHLKNKKLINIALSSSGALIIIAMLISFLRR